MDEEEDDRWPLWGEPATKGDIIGALVTVRSCIIDTLLCLRALNRGDKEKFSEYLNDLSKSDDALEELMDTLGGRQNKRG